MTSLKPVYVYEHDTKIWATHVARGLGGDFAVQSLQFFSWIPLLSSALLVFPRWTHPIVVKRDEMAHEMT